MASPAVGKVRKARRAKKWSVAITNREKGIRAFVFPVPVVLGLSGVETPESDEGSAAGDEAYRDRHLVTASWKE